MMALVIHGMFVIVLGIAGCAEATAQKQKNIVALARALASLCRQKILQQRILNLETPVCAVLAEVMAEVVATLALACMDVVILLAATPEAVLA